MTTSVKISKRPLRLMGKRKIEAAASGDPDNRPLTTEDLARMKRTPQAKIIRAMHADDLGLIRDVLKRYLTEWTGGPKLYSVEKGHPRLRQRHIGFAIGDAERDTWLLCMRGALEETVVDVAARQDLDRALSGLADWMRNR